MMQRLLERERENSDFSKETTKNVFLTFMIICLKVQFDAVKRKSDFFLNHNKATHI